MTLPHECPACGERFGWGEDAVLLSVVHSAPFDEPMPCCGTKLSGYVSRDGSIEWSEGAP